MCVRAIKSQVLPKVIRVTVLCDEAAPHAMLNSVTNSPLSVPTEAIAVAEDLSRFLCSFYLPEATPSVVPLPHNN